MGGGGLEGSSCKVNGVGGGFRQLGIVGIGKVGLQVGRHLHEGKGLAVG